jgi:hypothetical protein
MLMLFVFLGITCVGGKDGKRGNGYSARGPKMGQLALSMGPARAEVQSYIQIATIPSKRVIHTLNINKIPHM